MKAQLLTNVDIINRLQEIINNNSNNEIYYALFLLMLCSVVDLMLGIVKAFISKDIDFLSNKLQLGIFFKIGKIILSFILMLICIVLDGTMVYYYIFILSLVFGEIYSIAAHLDFVDDNKDTNNFYKKIFKTFFKIIWETILSNSPKDFKENKKDKEDGENDNGEE